IDQTAAPRIQTDSCGELAAFIAHWGANELGRPVMKAERALTIPALKGLPGVYWELLDRTLGANKLLSLIPETAVRTAQVSYVIAYCEPGEKPFVFEGGSKGTVTTKATPGKDFTLIEKIFVPEYRLLNATQTKTLAELASSEPQLVAHAWGDAESQ